MSRVLLTWVDGGGDTPPRDRGLLYGEGLFETIRVAAGRPFRLRAHLERMARSARELDLPLPPAGWQERVAEALAALAGRLPAEDGRARLTLTAGPAPEHGDPAAAPSGPASLFLSVSPLAADAAPAQAVTARFAGPPVPGGRDALTAHKTLSYLGHLLCLRAARAAGAAEGLVSTGANLLVGGARANIFVVAGGILRTPSPASGCLPGITRALILEELAPALGLLANEEEMPVTTAFREAHEVFLSNSIGGIVPVAEVEPTAWRRTAHGDVTASLQKAYGDLLARECGTE